MSISNTSYFLRLLLITLFLPALFYSGCDFGDIKPKSTTGSLSVAVDENVEPLMKMEVAEFQRLNPEAKIELRFLPTRNILAELINNQAKYVISTADFNEEEKKVIAEHDIKISRHVFAVDGIAFIVNPSNPVKRVTSEDIKKIFSGEYTQWDQVVSQDEEQNAAVKKTMTGKNSKIKLYIQRRNSGTYDFVQDSVMNNLEFSKNVNVCSTSAQMLDMIRQNENAIGISNLGWLATGNQDVLDTTVRPLKISAIKEGERQTDFIQFHQGLVFSGEYPYRRIVYIFTTEQGIKLASGFTTFLLNKDGQKVALESGMVPVTQPVRTVQIN